MMRKAVSLLAGILLPGALCLPVRAGHIALRTRPGAGLDHGRARVTLVILNAGDEPARSVWSEALVGGRAARTAPRDTLAVGATHRFVLAFDGAPAPPGIHTILLRVHYQDGAGRPCSTVTCIPLATADPGPAPDALTVEAAPVEVSRRATVSVRVSSRGPEPIAARVRLHLPDEFEARPAVRDVRIRPDAAQVVTFRVRNRAAPPSSDYAAVAVADYELRGLRRSVATRAKLRTGPSDGPLADRPGLALVIVLALLSALAALQAPRVRAAVAAPRWAPAGGKLLPWLALAGIAGLTLWYVPPAPLLTDTLTVGGDTPAHNYLASHLQESLFHHGRIVSWAGGWWCGFPMFQFYFCLPYLLIAALSFVIPFNIAFKLVSVAGVLLLPSCAYVAGRRLRLPPPAPALLAVAMVPLLFDTRNTMWGVSVYSTLAGMIANSLSFPIMLLFVAGAWRDADDGRFRLSTALLLAALLSSHFFTSAIAGLVVAAMPFFAPRAGARRALRVLAGECALGLLLMAWWLAPLLARRDYGVDFGENWKVDVAGQLPACVPYLAPFVLAAAVLGVRQRIRAVAILCAMLAVSLFLFYLGYDRVSRVFVNVRLWPFILFAVLALAAVGAGFLLRRAFLGELAALAALVAAFAWGIGRPNHAREWAEWNYTGLERKQRWPVFRDLVLPLKDTPGRLAWDLHGDNDALGSSRIFECVPHLIGKPVLEGGLVNSAVGSYFAYYIQGESSRSSAGYPTALRPAAFNMTNATRHLELANVKHFVARWEGTKEALARMPEWRLLRRSGDWSLYELTSHDGRYVFIPQREPLAVRTRRRLEAGREWLYAIEALDQPLVLLPEGGDGGGAGPGSRWGPRERPGGAEAGGGGALLANAGSAAITAEEVGDGRIRFTTRAVGAPHIIKCTYYPNWQVRGADRVYMVTPCFLLVYPRQAEVELSYEATAADNFGRALTLAGWGTLIAVAWRRRAARAKGKP